MLEREKIIFCNANPGPDWPRQIRYSVRTLMSAYFLASHLHRELLRRVFSLWAVFAARSENEFSKTLWPDLILVLPYFALLSIWMCARRAELSSRSMFLVQFRGKGLAIKVLIHIWSLSKCSKHIWMMSSILNSHLLRRMIVLLFQLLSTIIVAAQSGGGVSRAF